MKILIGVIILYIISVALSTGLYKHILPYEPLNKTIKTFAIGFGIGFAFLYALFLTFDYMFK